MKQKILVTSALPYANGPLHFGHIAGAYLPADCYARFQRLKGADILFICGSDEYGVAITLHAELAKRTPKEHVDHFHAVNQHFFHQLNIEFDHFSRTTCASHAPLVQQFFLDLMKNGYIEERETEQLYSEKDNRFLADRYVVGICPRCSFEEARGDECPKCGASYEATDVKHPRSKMTGATLSLKKTRHWFLLFDKFKDKLEKMLDSRTWKTNVLHFAKSYVDDLKPRAITRDLEWGIPVPLKEAEGKVFYVWFDAPIGYISATCEWAKSKGEPELWKEYWFDPKTKYVQFMGKDNIPFHAVFFPAMIMGQDQPYKCVDEISANEFFNLEGSKFSKSDGFVIDLNDFFKRFHADQIRYTIAANAPETSDAEFTWKDFQTRCNSELLGKLGNFVNRVLVFAQNHCQGLVPKQHPLEEVDLRFLNEITRIVADIEEQFASFRLRRASQLIMELAAAGNVYFDAKAPWKLAKEPPLRSAMETTISCCLECVKRLSLTSFPIIPSTAEKMWSLLGFSTKLSHQNWDAVLAAPIQEGASLPKPFILFQKIEDEVIAEEIEKLAATKTAAAEKQEPPFAPLKAAISIDEFAKIDLRIGLIVKTEKVAKSKKLLKLEVDIGLETRTVLSGISLHYTPDELIGKKVIVVANLHPASIMGIESNGMLLAGSIDAHLELVSVQDLPAGATVS